MMHPSCRNIGGIITATLMTGAAVLIASSGTASAAAGDPQTLQCDRPVEKGESTCTASSAPFQIPPGGFQRIDLPQLRCPGNYPYLLNENYDFWTVAPNGTQAIRDTDVGVNLGGVPFRDRDGNAVGTNRGGTAMTWSTAKGSVQVVLHCTDILRKSY